MCAQIFSNRRTVRGLCEDKFPARLPRPESVVSRLNPRSEEKQLVAAKNNIGILTGGGDVTLSLSAALSAAGMPVISIPKTMDNDVQGTEYCIGLSTAITRAKGLITRQRTTLGSHERIGIFRIFGRDAGFTALYTSYVTSIRCCVPEVPFDLDQLIKVLVNDKRSNPSRYSLVVLAEGASWKGRNIEEYGQADAYGHKKKVNIAEAFSDELKKRTGEDTVVRDLTYDIRSGD